MPQVVDASNLVEFVQTGKAPEFKAPEAKAPAGDVAAKQPAGAVEKGAAGGSQPTQARGADGKFTSSPAGDKTTPAATTTDKKGVGELDEGDVNLPEAVRQAIGKKHRQMKEAEEFARSEYRQRTAAEERAARLQSELDALKTKSGPSTTTEPPKEPKPEDFKTVAEYTDALVNFRVEQRFQADAAKREADAAKQAEAERQRQYAERAAKVREEHPDFEDVLNSLKGTELDNIHGDVIEAIQESEHGPRLVYHLAKNPDELRRLRKLSPKAFIREIGKLEAKWESAAPAPSSETTKTPTLTEVAATTTTPPAVSRAPAPITPLPSGVATVAVKPEEMSVAQLREHRRLEAQQKAAARR